jgi:hypothetical protein
MSAWWRQWGGGGAELTIFTARDASGVLIGLAPFYYQKTPLFKGLLPLTSLRSLCAHNNGSGFRTERQQFIVVKRGSELIIKALWGKVFSVKRWDELVVSDLVEHSAEGVKQTV